MDDMDDMDADAPEGEGLLQDLAEEVDDGDDRTVEEEDAAQEDESVEHEALRGRQQQRERQDQGCSEDDDAG
jgi:hypothetical protein